MSSTETRKIEDNPVLKFAVDCLSKLDIVDNDTLLEGYYLLKLLPGFDPLPHQIEFHLY